MIGRWRNATQAGALALLVLVPLANLHLQLDTVQGWYQGMDVAGVSFVSPLEGVESILVARDLYLPLLLGLLPSVLLAVLLGRVFCSWACPINTLSGLMDRVIRLFRRGEAPPARWTLPKRTLWYSLGASLLLVVLAGAPLFAFWSPPGLVGRELMLLVFFGTLAWEGVLILAVLALNAVTPRFFCRYVCPLGGLLAGLGAGRRLRVVHRPKSCTQCGECDRTCPLGLEPGSGGSATTHCWNCGKCVDACGTRGLALRFGSRGTEDALS
jgi:ferredoxin-type protein NapH